MYMAQDLRILVQITLVTFIAKNLHICRAIHLEVYLLGAILLVTVHLGECLKGESIQWAILGVRACLLDMVLL
jgi:hypothetical protein